MGQIGKAVIIIFAGWVLAKVVISSTKEEWDKATFHLVLYLVLSRAIDILLGCR
jgi:hypothetical protein